MRLAKAICCVIVIMLCSTTILYGQNIIKFDKEIYDFGTFEKGIIGEVIFEYSNLSKRRSFEIIEIHTSTTAVKVRENYSKLINPKGTHQIHILAKGGEKSGEFNALITIYYMNKKKIDRNKTKGKDMKLIKKLAKTSLLKISGNTITY